MFNVARDIKGSAMRVFWTIILVLLVLLPAREGASYQAYLSVSTDRAFGFNLELAEIFKKHKLRYTLAVVALDQELGRPGRLSWEDLRKLDADGFEIASHSMSHFYPNVSNKGIEISFTQDDKKPRAVIDLLNTPYGIRFTYQKESVNILSKTIQHSTLGNFVSTLNGVSQKRKIHLVATLADPLMNLLPTQELLSCTQIIVEGVPLTLYLRRGLSDEQLGWEICASKALIEERLGHSIVTYVYPWGDLSQTAINMCKKCGYLSARTTQEGYYIRQQGKTNNTLNKVLDLPDIHVRAGIPATINASQIRGDQWYQLSTNGELRGLLHHLQSRYQENRITESQILTPIGEFFEKAKQGGWWVHLLDHDGELKPFIYDFLLTCLDDDPDIMIAPIGEVATVLRNRR